MQKRHQGQQKQKITGGYYELQPVHMVSSGKFQPVALDAAWRGVAADSFAEKKFLNSGGLHNFLRTMEAALIVLLASKLEQRVPARHVHLLTHTHCKAPHPKGEIPMASRNVETVRTAHECWNRRDFEGCVRNLRDDCTYIDHCRGETLKGKQKFKDYLEGWAKPWKDGKITNVRYTDAGDTVIAEFVCEGTNDGSLAGMSPTGRRASFDICEIWHFDKDGKITSGGCYYDMYGLLTQLGHLKPITMAA
jgi:steroid delta-isomerase-like uncharacterized protein